MARLVDVRVPDMGNFSEVAIIDVLVKPGDAIEREASLITLETEKATMDVPSDVAGVIEKLHVAKGGKVSPGDVVATVRVEGEGAAVVHQVKVAVLEREGAIGKLVLVAAADEHMYALERFKPLLDLRRVHLGSFRDDRRVELVPLHAGDEH